MSCWFRIPRGLLSCGFRGLNAFSRPDSRVALAALAMVARAPGALALDGREQAQVSSGHIVIVGAGQAGVQAVASLRAEGHQGAITLLGDEAFPPYQRPPLSKAYLSGDLARERLFLR